MYPNFDYSIAQGSKTFWLNFTFDLPNIQPTIIHFTTYTDALSLGASKIFKTILMLNVVDSFQFSPFYKVKKRWSGRVDK